MTLSEVSAKYDLSQYTLRYYDEEDCRWIEFIKCMRGASLPLEVLIEY